MTTRSVGWRGFSVEVGVPDPVVARLRRLVGSHRAEPARPPLFSTHTPPPVTPRRRDRQGALDFLRDPALAGDGRSPNRAVQETAIAAHARQQAATTLADKVAAHWWYQTIELPGGIVTPGTHDHRPLVPLLGLPADLSGQRALDVATFNGFWAFELERRGAEVVALDLPTTASLDLPAGVEAIVAAEELAGSLAAPFVLARDALGSSVTKVEGSVYDLDPDVHGTFDLVFCGDLILHLRSPMEALAAIRRVCTGTFVLADRYDPAITGRGDTLVRYEGGWHSLAWWTPSLEALVQMVADAGFSSVEVRGGYQIAPTDGTGLGWSRAIVVARV